MSKSTAESYDEAVEQFREMHDGLPSSLAAIADYDIEAQFRTEPYVGHSVYGSVVTRNDTLSNELQKASDELDIPFDQRKYVILEQADVDWSSTKSVRLQTDTFEDLLRWYVEQQSDMMLVEESEDDE